MEDNSKIESVIIIGGGVAGLAAAIYTARASLKPIVFAGSPPGGQLTLTSEVENYPGFESILGSELILKMRKHAEKFGARIIDENVQKVDFRQKPFRIYTINSINVGVGTKSVIIATGAKALWLGLDSEKRLRGRGVSACATCDGFFFRNKAVGVAGGGDTAMEEALTLTKFASKVFIIHRRDSFRASKIMQERVFANPKIEVIWNAMIKEVVGKEKVEGVKLKQLNNLPAGRQGETMLSLDGLFIAIGHKPDTDVFKDKIKLDEKGYIITTERFNAESAKFNLNYSYMTSVEGVFAAGDCVDYKYRQAGTASGMGIAAALEVEKWLEI